MQEAKSLDKILRRVQLLIEKAEAPNFSTNEAEWEATDIEQKEARRQADALMLQYAIDEAMAEAAKPADIRRKPIVLEYVMGGADLSSFVGSLAYDLAQFTRCKIKPYARYDRDEHVQYGKVSGYESDARYFLFLYTTLRLHMIGALRPKINPAESLEENVYRLHHAGYNWREIAKLYGWRKATYEEAKEYDFPESWTRDDGEDAGKIFWVRTIARKYNLAYQRAAKAHGTEKLKVPASAGDTFRASAAEGYTDRMRQRLDEVERKRDLEGAGSALELRIEDLEQFYREENASRYHRCPACQKLSAYDWQCDVCGNTDGMAEPPPAAKECERCKKALPEYLAGKRKSPYCRDHTYRTYERKYSQVGYAAGVQHANAADLTGRTVHNTTKSIN